jgi:hypothetical protein
VSQVARLLEPGLRLPASAAGEAVLAALRDTPASEYLVVDRDGRSVGVLATRDVALLLRRWGGDHNGAPTDDCSGIGAERAGADR